MVTKGDTDDIGRLLPGRDNIVVSENLAVRHNIKPGDSLVLTTPQGPVSFGVIAVIVDYGYEFGAVLMDNLTYQKHWHDNLADIITVQVKEKRDIDLVRDAIQKQQGKQKRLFIFSMEEYKKEGQKMLDQIYGIFHAMDILTLSIACIGIIITLLASVLERRREIGIIRSIGGYKGQVSRVVVLESVLLGLTGCFLGIMCGSRTGLDGRKRFYKQRGRDDRALSHRLRRDSQGNRTRARLLGPGRALSRQTGGKDEYR